MRPGTAAELVAENVRRVLGGCVEVVLDRQRCICCTVTGDYPGCGQNADKPIAAYVNGLAYPGREMHRRTTKRK